MSADFSSFPVNNSHTRLTDDEVMTSLSHALVLSALPTSAMLVTSFLMLKTSVSPAIVGALQRVAAGIVISAVACELVPVIKSAPRDHTPALIGGFLLGIALLLVLGRVLDGVEEDDPNRPPESSTACQQDPHNTPQQGKSLKSESFTSQCQPSPWLECRDESGSRTQSPASQNSRTRSAMNSVVDCSRHHKSKLKHMSTAGRQVHARTLFSETDSQWQAFSQAFGSTDQGFHQALLHDPKSFCQIQNSKQLSGTSTPIARKPAAGHPTLPVDFAEIAGDLTQQDSCMIVHVFPSSFAAAVFTDSFVDGFLIGVASAGASGGFVLAIALSIEMTFVALTFATAMKRQRKWKGLLAVLAAPLLLVMGSLFGAALFDVCKGTSLETALISFGIAALLFLVTEELLLQAHEASPKDGQSPLWVDLCFFLGFLIAFILDKFISKAI